MAATSVLVGAFHAQTSVMGPGSRACLWVAGCSLNCRGCATPELIGKENGKLRSIGEICGWIDEAIVKHGIEGLSFSGGEPFEQAEALALIAAHARSRGLSTLSWSGYVRKHLEGPRAPEGSAALLATLDVLIDGPFLDRMLNGDPLRGSSNQKLMQLTGRYAEKDFLKQQKIDVHLPRNPGEPTVINGVADTRGMRAILRVLGVHT